MSGYSACWPGRCPIALHAVNCRPLIGRFGCIISARAGSHPDLEAQPIPNPAGPSWEATRKGNQQSVGRRLSHTCPIPLLVGSVLSEYFALGWDTRLKLSTLCAKVGWRSMSTRTSAKAGACAIFHMYSYVGRHLGCALYPHGGMISRRESWEQSRAGEKRQNVNLTEAPNGVCCLLFFQWDSTIGRCWRVPGADCVWFLGRSAVSRSRRFV